MNEHLHVGVAELLVFALMLIVAGGLIRLLAAWLGSLDSPAARRVAGALGFVY